MRPDIREPVGGADDPTTCLVPPMAGRFAGKSSLHSGANPAGLLDCVLQCSAGRQSGGGMMAWRRLGVMTGLSMVLWACSGSVLARTEDAPSSDATVTKTSERLHFKLPPDWPIEKRGGVTAPIPVEEYLAMKFNAVQSQLQILEQRFNGFDVRLRALEEAAAKQKQGLRSEAASAP